MEHTTILNKLNELGFKGFKVAYEHQIEDVNYDTLGFGDKLFQLLDAQDIFLKNKKITMAFRLSKIKDKQACLDAVDFGPRRKINKAQIHSLAELNFIHSKQNIIITGTNLLKKYSRFKLIVLDDFGIAPMLEDDATNLFEIIEARTEVNSTIITSQLPDIAL